MLIISQYGVVVLVAAIISWLAIQAVLYLFPKVGLLDRPHKYGLKRAPIPYYAGLAIFVAFWLTLAIFLPFDARFLGLLLISFLVLLISFWDDYRGVPPLLRLLMQLLVGVAIYLIGFKIESISNPFGGVIDLSWLTLSIGAYPIEVLAMVFVILWMVLIMNTINWIDGLNGLPSGVSAIAALIIFLLAIRPGMHAIDQVQVATAAAILFGVMVVFWRYDFFPAKILMGDTGSMFLGLILAVLALMSGGKIATLFLVLGFPILDAIWVIFRRILSGKSPFKGDYGHLHHRLLDAGFSVRKALLIIYAGCLGFGLLAVFLGTREKLWAIIVLFLVVALVGMSVVYQSLLKK